MECQYLHGCPFYNDKMPMQHGVGAIYKKKYCKENHEQCARYKVICEAGYEAVPDSLYPNMYDIALKIMNEAKSK